MKTRLISLLLAFSMALTFLPVGAVSAFAAETGDTFNFNGLTYEITSDTTAKVKGPEATTLLTQVTIPEKATNSLNGESYTVTAIADKAFRNTRFNGEITSITLPDSLKEIGDFAFFSCLKLEDINLPDGLTKIGYQAFQNCYSLTEITIPSSVTTMSSHVFNRCIGLKKVTFEKNSQLSALPDATFANCESLESFTLPNGFTSIGENAFYKCGNLTTLNISDDVTEIKKDAFIDCAKFNTINYDGTKYSWNALLKSGSVDNTVLEKIQADGFTVNYWVQPLVVSGGIFTVDGDPVVGDTAIVPVGATVEITFDQQSFADSGLSFGSWEIDGLSNSEYYKNKESFTFTMPKNRVAVTASTMDIPSAPTIDNAPVDPAISTAVTIIGGALLVGGLHQLGTELWLIHHLPKGTAIPETRIELAEVLWKDAGQPAPAAEAAYTDIDTDDTDAQQAAQWAIAGLHRKSHSRVEKGTADETVYQVTPNGIKTARSPFLKSGLFRYLLQPTHFSALPPPFLLTKQPPAIIIM